MSFPTMPPVASSAASSAVSSMVTPPAVSVTQQLQSVLSSVAALEQQARALAADNAALRQQLSPPAGPTDTPTPTPPPVTPSSSPVEWGFVANDVDPLAAVKAAIVRTAADGGRWLRLWHSHFGAFSAGTNALIDAAAAAGVRVILCVQPKDGPAKDGSPKSLGSPEFAGFVTRNTAALRKVTYVEVGNELNLNQYRPDDLGTAADWHGPYVRRWLRPMALALSTIGVKTLCTSVTDTYHPDTYAQQSAALLAAGAADCCDGLAVHAYFVPQFLPRLATILTDLKTAWAKPIFVTECNVQTRGLTAEQWQAQFPPYLSALRTAGVAAAVFYRGVPRPSGGWSWPTLFDASGKPTPAYDVLRAAIEAPAT